MTKTLLTLFAFAALAVTTLTMKADSSNSAVVINHGTGICGMPGSDANGNIIFGGIGVFSHEVSNDNVVTETCKGDNITNLSGSGQNFSGFACGIVDPATNQFHVTTDTHAVVSKSGNASMQCTYKK
jgi:hypothetical protein